MKYLLGFIVAALLIASCKKDDNQREIDDMLIMEYVDSMNLDAESTASGLYIVIDEPGSDEHPTVNSTVSVAYRGEFLDGDVFDSSNGSPVTFGLWNVIEGWQEGIPYFGKGGSGMLIVPSHLAYGPSGYLSIPPNTVLAFDVELVDFN